MAPERNLLMTFYLGDHTVAVFSVCEHRVNFPFLKLLELFRFSEFVEKYIDLCTFVCKCWIYFCGGRGCFLIFLEVRQKKGGFFFFGQGLLNEAFEHGPLRYCGTETCEVLL